MLDLPGGSFAFNMATGIVPLAAIPLGHDNVAAAFFALNLFAFPLLCVFMLVRFEKEGDVDGRRPIARLSGA